MGSLYLFGCQQGLERISQCLAALIEGLTNNFLEQLVVFGRMWQHVMRHQADNCRVNFRWRIERSWTDVEQVLNTAVILHHDRQSPPVTTARLCSQAFNHLLMQHEMHIANQRDIIEPLKDQWGGDVVREISDHSQAVR